MIVLIQARFQERKIKKNTQKKKESVQLLLLKKIRLTDIFWRYRLTIVKMIYHLYKNTLIVFVKTWKLMKIYNLVSFLCMGTLEQHLGASPKISCFASFCFIFHCFFLFHFLCGKHVKSRFRPVLFNMYLGHTESTHSFV